MQAPYGSRFQYRLKIEEAAVGRWRKQLFWSGVLAGLAFGFILYPFLPPSSAVAVTEVAGLTGFIGFVAVCAIAGKWGGGIGGFFLAVHPASNIHTHFYAWLLGSSMG